MSGVSVPKGGSVSWKVTFYSQKMMELGFDTFDVRLNLISSFFRILIVTAGSQSLKKKLKFSTCQTWHFYHKIDHQGESSKYEVQQNTSAKLYWNSWCFDETLHSMYDTHS